MKRKIYLVILSLCLPALAAAQATLSSKDMVSITPMLSYHLDLPTDAVKSLNLKLNQMVTQNGFGATSGQFVLTANVVTLNKDATATAPPQYIVDLEVSFFVVNVMEGVIVDEMSYEVKGVDRLENKAMIQAINQIKPKSPQVRTFMNNVREQIITYYNTRIPAIMTKAQSLADRNQYEDALAELAMIPESVDQYPMVAEQMTAIYIKMVDRTATAAIQEAKGYIAVRDYESAIYALSKVDPSSNKSSEAFALIEQVKGTLDAEEQRLLDEELKRYEEQKEFALRAHDDAVMLRKMQIEAAQKVGVESAKTESTVTSKLNAWFLGKFK